MRTVYCSLQSRQNHRKRLFRPPVFLSFMAYTSALPQRTQQGLFPHRCFSRNSTAAVSSEHASGICSMRLDLERLCPFFMSPNFILNAIIVSSIKLDSLAFCIPVCVKYMLPIRNLRPAELGRNSCHLRPNRLGSQNEIGHLSVSDNPTQADSSSSPPWSVCRAVSGFRFMGMSSCRSMFTGACSSAAQRSARRGAFSDRTAPLKPKDGLRGTPARGERLLAQAASCPTLRRAQGRLFRKVRERWGTLSCYAVGKNH